jgi:hypothetical protein
MRSQIGSHFAALFLYCRFDTRWCVDGLLGFPGGKTAKKEAVLSRATALIVLQLGSRPCDCDQTPVIAFDMTI